MANTRAVLLPFAAEFPSSNFPQMLYVGSTPRRPALAFDASTVEGCRWTGVAPQGLTGTLKARIFYIMASATSGDVDFELSVEAVTDADALDLDASESFDSVNAGNVTVPGTAGYLDVLEITLTNKDNIAAGDYFRVKLERDADDVTNDTATGDCYVLAVEIQDNV
jgi:hypothetical protein